MNTTKELFGLTDKEMEIYKFLLKNPSKNSSEIAEGIGMQRPNTYDLLKTLLSKGLISYSSKGKVKTYSAVHPTKLKDIYQHNKQILNQKESDVNSFVDALTKSMISDSSDLKIQFYQGVKGMRSVLMDAIEESKKTKKEMVIVRLNFEDLPSLDKDYTDRFFMLRNRYNIRSKYLHLRNTKFFEDSLVESKILQDKYLSSVGWYIYGNKVSIWMLPKKETILVIDNKEIADSMRKNFQFMWDKAS